MRLYAILKYFLPALLILLIFNSCTRRDLMMRPNDGYLRIILDWRHYAPPKTTGFYFYNSKGDAPLYREGTYAGFEGYLPAEIYKVVIFNTDMVQADVVNMNSYDEDHVLARPLETKAGLKYLNHVDKVFATGITEVVVPKGKVAEERFAEPENFVKTVTCIIHPEDVKNIGTIDVELCGAVTGRYHVSNLPNSDETALLKSTAVYKVDSNTYEASIKSLGYMGVCDMNLLINYKNDSKEELLPITLTEELNNFPEDNKTVEVTLPLSTGEEIKVNILIHGWKDEGGTEIPIN